MNGKMPSQDLSAWVRGQVGRSGSTFIPPLKEISPLSIGEVQKDPLEERMGVPRVCPYRRPRIAKLTTPIFSEALDLHAAPDNASAIAADASSIRTATDTVTSGTVSVGTVSEDTAVSDAGADVSAEGPDDPDMLVLGFQELDLSAEALLYSTKTVREDAWCMAVFAGLGEKAALYEKVGAPLAFALREAVFTRRPPTHGTTLRSLSRICTAIARVQTAGRHAPRHYHQEAAAGLL